MFIFPMKNLTWIWRFNVQIEALLLLALLKKPQAWRGGLSRALFTHIVRSAGQQTYLAFSSIQQTSDRRTFRQTFEVIAQ
jgi:hypothetical protein